MQAAGDFSWLLLPCVSEDLSVKYLKPLFS